MSRNWFATRISLLMIILVASLSGSPALAQGAATVRVDPPASSVPVNNTVSIAIKADNTSNLTAFEIHLLFDPAVLEVTSMSNGGFVAADFTAQNTFDNATGTIDYAIAQMNRAPAQGSGTLLNIVFRAKAHGSSTVTTRATQAAPDGLILADQNGTAIAAAWVPGNINVETITPTDTPTPTPTQTPTLVVATNTPTATPSTGTPSATPTPTATGTGTPTATPTSTRTPTATPTSTSSRLAGTHIVRWGEWLYCIGRAYKVSPWAIAKENGLWWPYLIFPNQKLIIPNVPWTNMPAGPVCKAQFTVPASNPTPTVSPTFTATPTVAAPPTATPTATSTAPTATPTATVAPSACRTTYVVRPGDSLYRIALRFGTNYTEIAQVNHIANPRLIYPGQQLCIP